MAAIAIMPIIDMTQKVLDACVLRRQVTRLVGPGECFYLGRRGPSPPAFASHTCVSPCKQLIRAGQQLVGRHVAGGGEDFPRPCCAPSGTEVWLGRTARCAVRGTSCCVVTTSGPAAGRQAAQSAGGSGGER